LVSTLFSDLASLDPSDRPNAGNNLNKLKNEILADIQSKVSSLGNSSEILSKSFSDLTLPGKNNNLGSQHPLSIVINNIESIFTKIGFSIASS